MYLYIVDEGRKLVGIVDIRELLQAKEDKELRDIGTNRIVSLKPKSTMRQALQLFERYDYRAMPIVDHTGEILGVIPYRDIKKLKHRLLE